MFKIFISIITIIILLFTIVFEVIFTKIEVNTDINKYNDNDYKKEVERLEKYNSTEYYKYYSVEGFSKYKLLAIYADSYNGFVYAITDDENTIIYVELIFCNYFFDIDYKEYIDEKYLPDGFDASKDNKYKKENFYKN